MKHLEIKINNHSEKVIDISIAENWNELTENQLLYISLCWQSWQLMLRNNADMQYAKAKLFVALVNDKSNAELKQILNLLSCIDFEEQDVNPLSLVNFVFEANTLTKNNFLKLKSGLFKSLYGPSDKLANISINEFSFALNFYNQYNKTENEEFLNTFVACLYRPARKNWEDTGDIRKSFNPFTISQYLPQVEKISFSHKQAVYLLFTGCLDYYSKVFVHVFSRATEEQKESKQTFLDIILKISGGKFGNFDQTKDQNAFLVLKELNTMIEENQNKSKK